MVWIRSAPLARPLSRRAVLAASLSTMAAVSPALGTSNRVRPAVVAFKEEVLAILHSDFPEVTITPDDDPEQIVIGRFTIFLGNLRQKSAGMSVLERRTVILNHFRRYATAKPLPETRLPPESFAQASPRLRIQLVPNEYRDQVPSLTCRRFSDRLLVAYALDEDKRYQLVTQSIFESWGVDQDTVERIARRNLELASGGIQVHISETGKSGHFATLAEESGYAAASLLLPMVMDQIREGLGTPTIVAAVPTRDILIAWSSDSEGKDRLASIVTMYMLKGPYARSDELFSYSAEGLRPLDVGELAEHGRQTAP